MKREVQDAFEAAKQELIVRLTKQEQEFVTQANKFAEREDFKVGLRYAMDARAVQKKREALENTDALQAVTSSDDAMEVFLDRVKEYVSSCVKEIHRQLFLAALRPREFDKKALDSALIDIELVASDIQQLSEKYPVLDLYIKHLRSIQKDVETVLKEIV